MRFHDFKPYAKYGLFLIFIISLVGTAYADTNGPVHYSLSVDSGNTTVDSAGYGNKSTNNDSFRIITKLDNKPWGIALSWDDSAHIETCYQYLSIFQKYGATCTINVNSVINRPQTVRDQLNALHAAGWEIACHGYNHLNSRQFLDNSTPAAWLKQEIFPNIVEVAHYNYPVYTLAYPYSDRDAATDAAVAPYFRTLRTRAPDLVHGNVNETTLAYYNWNNAQLLYGIEIDDQSGASIQSLEAGIDRAKQTGSVLILYGHLITENVDGRYMTSTSRLESILDYVSRNGGKYYHMGELGNSSWVPPANLTIVAANYTVSSNSIYTGDSVTFVDYSIDPATELLDFGDGSPTTSTANVTHTYTKPGNYTAKLTVTNGALSDSMIKTITVNLPTIPAPVAGFTSNCTTGSQPLSIAFEDASTGSPTSWLWDFGDGSTAANQNPVHEYLNVGNFSVTLTVANDRGSNLTQKINYITVLPQTLSPNFCSNVTSGNLPLTVQFNDTSTGCPISWSWDFGDGYTSNEQNPVHTYSAEGNYLINLTVSNGYGTDSKTSAINVLKGISSSNGSDNSENNNNGNDNTANGNDNSASSSDSSSSDVSSSSSSHSSGSSGGGGSAGGSPEPQSNVEVKELSQAFVSSGNQIKFDFPQRATFVVNVSFDSKKTVGKTTTIVEILKGKSVLVSELPSDEVYKYLNIWVGNSGFAIPKNIENAVVYFKVEKSWIQDKKIDQSSITLNRYSDGKWNLLSTRQSGEDDSYIYFVAETPGFSPFAITGKTTTTSVTGIQPASGSKTQPAPVNEAKTEPNTGSTAGNNESIPEQKESPGASANGSTKMPGFEFICGVISLLAVFLYQRK